MFMQQSLFLILFVGLALSAALPSRRCSGPNYTISENVIPLYPPFIPINGVFSADITVGSQTLRAGLDTGSSDTWFIVKDANCTDYRTLQPVKPEQCGYSGPRWTPDATFKPIPGVNLNQSYGTGENVNGPLGYESLVFGGLTIPKQEIGAVNYASVGNDPEGNVSGLIGLAYPNATSAYPGIDPSKDVICADKNASCGPVPYPPLMTTIFNDNLTEPIFAMALSRSNTSGGLISIGGIPDPQDPYVNATSDITATVPIEPYANTTLLLDYYVRVDNFTYTNATHNAGQGQYILDTGTGINVLPDADADAFNALFQPPAVLNASIGQYTLPCNATAPQLGVSIGGQVFYHNPQDLIIPAPGANGQCFSGVQRTLAVTKLPILGAPFLKNVLAVFDLGMTEVTLMSRVYYEDS